MLRSAFGFSAAQFDLSSDKIVSDGYDGDGRTDLAIFRDGLWAVLQTSDNLPRYQQFGQDSDIPVPGDTTVPVKPTLPFGERAFSRLRRQQGSPTGLNFGTAADFPVANVLTN